MKDTLLVQPVDYSFSGQPWFWGPTKTIWLVNLELHFTTFRSPLF